MDRRARLITKLACLVVGIAGLIVGLLTDDPASWIAVLAGAGAAGFAALGLVLPLLGCLLGRERPPSTSRAGERAARRGRGAPG